MQADRDSAREAEICQERRAGVLYCGTCDKYFGNEKVFKRHFIFGVKHGEESRDMRDLYYRVWELSWADEARQRAEEAGQTKSGRVEEFEEMEM